MKQVVRGFLLSVKQFFADETLGGDTPFYKLYKYVRRRKGTVLDMKIAVIFISSSSIIIIIIIIIIYFLRGQVGN